MRHRNLVIGGRGSPRRMAMATIVPLGSRGMKDSSGEVRSATARAMLAARYANTPKFKAKCGYPPCPVMIEGYQRGGKRKKYCSAAHNTAACRLRQSELGIGRTVVDGKMRTVNKNAINGATQRPDPGG